MRKKQVISELEKDASERQTDLKELQEKVRKASAAGDYETVKLLIGKENNYQKSIEEM